MSLGIRDFDVSFGLRINLKYKKIDVFGSDGFEVREEEDKRKII